MHPLLHYLLRDIFLTFLGIGIFGLGLYYAVKANSEHGWVGGLAALCGAGIFLLGFSSIIGMFWGVTMGLSK
ncbi:MAG: hypothetical protein HY289_04825 [Planctomycetes bacterium]|nr:hypothetical protein [Planctomycetota bacterium]